MYIQFNRAQAIALFAVTMQSGLTASFDILDKNNIETITIRANEDGYSFEYELPVYGGFILKSTAIH